MIEPRINILRSFTPDPQIVAAARLKAARIVWNGRDSPAGRRYLNDCRHYDPATRTLLIFTRENGFNSNGWWKNPDYERCFHLSLSFLAFERDKKISLPYDYDMAAKWVEAFFGNDAKLTWHEGPASEDGKAKGVHHYRLFCDEAWRPIKPRGEVYSKDWTPAGWKSFSDIHGDKQRREGGGQ